MDEREPPEIELYPGEYREKRRGISVHTGQMIASLVMASGILAFTFWNRAELDQTTLFVSTAVVAAMGGAAATILLRRWI